MSCLKKNITLFELTPEVLDKAISSLIKNLEGRVNEAYIFGSAADGSFKIDSDIDLLLVQNDSVLPFVKRGFAFVDIFEIFPRLDVIVYTSAELKTQLADSEFGFWRSVRLSMKRIL